MNRRGFLGWLGLGLASPIIPKVEEKAKEKKASWEESMSTWPKIDFQSGYSSPYYLSSGCILAYHSGAIAW